MSVGRVERLAEDTALHVDLGGLEVCLARSRGRIYALLDECSHEQVPISEGDVAGGRIECWMHGSRFDLATGVPLGPPATRPIRVYPVRVSGGNIEVALPADREAER